MMLPSWRVEMTPAEGWEKKSPTGFSKAEEECEKGTHHPPSLESIPVCPSSLVTALRLAMGDLSREVWVLFKWLFLGWAPWQVSSGPFLRLLQRFGSHGHEPCWISKSGVLEAHLSCASLKSWDAFLGYKPSGSSSVQFSCSVMSNSLWSHGLHHAGLSCPSPTPGAYSNSCHRVSDAIQPIQPLLSPFSSSLQPFPESESFQMSQFFTSGGQSIRKHQEAGMGFMVKLGLRLSYCFAVAFFSFSACEGDAQLVFKIFSEEIIPYIAIYSVVCGKRWVQNLLTSLS